MADEICDCGSTDSKDSIEFVDNNTLSAFPMVDSEFLNDIEEPIGEILSKETLDEVLNGKGKHSINHFINFRLINFVMFHYMVVFYHLPLANCSSVLLSPK